VWKSETTGREFEVRETDSYAPALELAQGALGFLTFAGGVPTVTERPLDRSERLRRHQQRSAQGRAGGTEVRQPPSLPLGWLLGLVLLVIVLWQLVAR
jgi:hypothetical protein